MIEQAGKIAAVVNGAERREIRQLIRLDVIDLAELDGIATHLPRRRIYEALDDVIAFRPPGAAIRTNWNRVRERADYGGFDQGRSVNADRVAHDVAGRDERWPRRQVSPEIGEHRKTHCKKPPVCIERQRCMYYIIAALMV